MDELNLCRLCFTRNKNSINIFDENGRNLQIAHILTKHFWFQVLEHDDYSDKICLNCWHPIESFHLFYTSIEIVQKEQQQIQLYNDEKKDFEKINEIIEATEVKSVKESTVAVSLDPIKYEEDNNFDDNTSVRGDPVESSDESEKECDLRTSQELDSTSSLSEAKSTKIKKVIPVRVKRKLNKRSKKESTIKRAQFKKEDEQIRNFFKLECSVCDCKFDTFRQTKRHYQTLHPTNKSFLVCCGRKLDKRITAVDHMKYHLNPEIFKCKNCNKICSNKSMLRKHIADNHATSNGGNHNTGTDCDNLVGETNGNFGCDICGKFYRTKNILALHIRGVHERAYEQICDICAKIFKSKAVLESHRQLHFFIPPKLQCSICGTWLANAHSLRCHAKIHKDNPQKCPLCDKISPNSAALKKHINYVHSERSHKCTMCIKSFKLAVELKEHVATHTGENLYTCPYCPKTFSCRGNMHKHRKASHFTEWKRDQSKYLRSRAPK